MKRVAIIFTGGTIGMIREKQTNVPCNDPDMLLSIIPEINQIAEIGWVNLFNTDSCMIGIDQWNSIAYKIYELYAGYDGFVIMHGTDTMVYTATALSFIMKNLNKPIIFTGSQKPLSERRNDARNNIINSIEFAASGIRETAVCFSNELLRANRTAKASSIRYDAFVSPNFPALAIIGIDIEWSSLVRKAHKKQKEPLFIDNIRLSNIPILKVHPNFDRRFLDNILSMELDGIIIEAFGSGTLPNYGGMFSDFIAELSKRNIPSVLTSQCIHGTINPVSYETGRQAVESGAINGRNITTEAAYVKLQYILSHYNHLDTIKKIFYEDIAGETD